MRYSRHFFQKSIEAISERALSALAIYVVPLAIGLVSIMALLFWDEHYVSNPEQQLSLRAFIETDASLSLADAKDRLATAPVSRQFETKLSEKTVWFSLNLKESSARDKAIEFPSRHMMGLTCWDDGTLAPLGEFSKTTFQGPVSAVKAGYQLKLDSQTSHVLCRANFVGPARLTAVLWSTDQLEASSKEFHRMSGMLDGGIVVLSLFVLITALINREKIYLIFGIWLMLGLRVGSTSGGWDTQWLGYTIPTDWLPLGRSLTMASYAMFTLSLYRTLFRNELTKTWFDLPIKITHWLCLPLLLLAFVLPRSQFIPTVWFIAGPGLILMTLSLVAIIIKTRSNVAIWYGTSLTVTFLSGISEILLAAYGVKGLISIFNSVTAALAASLLASLAIAAQMRQEHKARLAAQNQLQHTYDTVPVGMFTLDLHGRFTSINPALRRMLGPRAFKSEHNTWQQYFGADLWHQLLDLVQNRQDGEIEIRNQMDINGFEAPRRYSVKAALSGDKIEGSLQDVTERSIAAEELNFLADNDAMTKVLNRRGVEKAFYEAVAAIDESHPLALAYLDLDRFKLINDLYGHNAGDEVLRQVCQRVNVLLAAHMKLGRVGGDEFVILLPDTRMPLATVIARGIIENIDEKPFRVGEKAFYVRGSIGLIEVGAGTQFKEVLSTSDRACREAKSGQHRGLVVYEQGSPAFKEHQAELRLIGELSASENIEGLYLEMQPIMSLTRPSDALNFEVLLRMRDSAGELLPVSRVIAAAEDSGRMSKIDHWVLTTTLAWLDQHRERLQRTQFVCINLSGASLNDEEFMQEVFGILRRNSHVSSFLTIEITESVALHDLKNTRRFIDKVRGYGARVALDDFGAGYTSFSYLKELPADLLKIDGSFVVNMNQHPANVSIVEAIVNLARNLGMKTIAEWAEDAATVQALAEIGVDYVQGYAVARPMAPEKLLEVSSASSFIKDTELLQFVEAQDRQNNPLAQLDLLMEGEKPSPPKIH